MFSTTSECRYVLCLVVVTISMVVINTTTAKPMTGTTQSETDNQIVESRETADKRELEAAKKCRGCQRNSNICKNVRLTMESNHHICRIDKPCTCECCGNDLKCSSSSNGPISFCAKNNGAESLKK